MRKKNIWRETYEQQVTRGLNCIKKHQNSVASYFSAHGYITGPSRATAGPGETFLRGPQTFSHGSSGEKIFEFSFSKWYILAYFINFWPRAGPPKCGEASGSLPPYPTLSMSLLHNVKLQCLHSFLHMNT